MKYKGYQVSSQPTLDNVEEAISEGANIIRWQISSITQDIDAWKFNVEQQLYYFKQSYKSLTLQYAHYVLDLHTAPSEDLINNVKWFWGKAHDLLMTDLTVRFGILNEPPLTAVANAKLMREVYKSIRSKDPHRIICVTCPYSDPNKFKSIPYMGIDKNVWYEFHYYLPLNFTHQGIYQYPEGKKFPTIRNNVETMRKHLDQVYKFKEKYPKAQMFVGEFSCVDFADDVSRSNYVRECIKQFKRLGAHWCFHAWKEWEHWQPSGKTLEVLRNNLR